MSRANPQSVALGYDGSSLGSRTDRRNGRDGLGEFWTERRQGVRVCVRRLRLRPDVSAEVDKDATAAASLSHPNLLRPLEVGEQNGRLQLVSEMEAGITLRELVTELAEKRQRLGISQATWICLEVLRGLEQAHQQSDNGRAMPVVHGRVSPDHIWLTPGGDVRLSGFGLDAAARSLLDEKNVLDPAFAYVSPEQCAGELRNPASDVFSVGCILGELLTVDPLFLKSSWAETAQAIQSSPAPVFRARRSELPLALCDTLNWCLEKAHAKRPRVELLVSRISGYSGMLDVGDKVKPGQHPAKLAELIRQVFQTAPELDDSTDPQGAQPPPEDDPVATRIIANPLFRESNVRPRISVRSDERRFPWGWVAAAVASSLCLMALSFTDVTSQLIRTVASHWPFPATQSAPPPPVLTPPPRSRVQLPEPPPPPGMQKIRPATLTIRSKPVTRVLLDGVLIGTTPLRELSVPPGEHVIELQNRKRRTLSTQRLILHEGESRTLNVDLKN